MLAAPLSAATSASVAASAGNDVARAPRAVAAPTRRKVIVFASANGSETISDRVALGRTKLAAALVAIPLIIGAPGIANADDEFIAAPVEEAAAPVEEAAAPVDEAAAPVEEAAPYVAPVPQGTDDAMSAYEAATRTGGNSSTAKRVVEQSKPKKSGGGGGILVRLLAVRVGEHQLAHTESGPRFEAGPALLNLPVLPQRAAVLGRVEHVDGGAVGGREERRDDREVELHHDRVS